MSGGSETNSSLFDRSLQIALRCLLVAAVLAPLIHLLVSLVRNYYPIPYYDSWNFYYRLASYLQGTSSLGHYLFSQQNEARPVIARLLLLVIHLVSPSLTIDVVLNVGSAVCAAGATILLLRRTNPGAGSGFLLLGAILFNLNFFSLAQWQNWNWRNQLIMLLPNLFFALGWLINFSSLRSWLRGLVVSLCCVASTFSFANGLFQWFLLVPLAFDLGWRQRVRLWSIHVSVGLLCFVLYFTDYQRPEGHDPRAGLTHPGRSILYYFTWLGSSLSADSQLTAQILGTLLFMVFFLLVLLCAIRWRREGLQPAWLPWISMGLYALTSGAATALGRSHIGLEQALRPRYCTISEWLIVGIIGLGATQLHEHWQRSSRQRNALALGLGLFAAGFLWFQGRHSMRAAEEWREFAERMRFERQSFGLEQAQPGQLWSFDHPNRELVLKTYEMMKKEGFLRDSFHSARILPELALPAESRRSKEGAIVAANCFPFREIHCRGWTIGVDPKEGERVLIVLVNAESGKVLAIGDGPIDQPRPDVVRRIKRRSKGTVAGFDVTATIPKMMAGNYYLVACDYGKSETSYRLIGKQQLISIPKQ